MVRFVCLISLAVVATAYTVPSNVATSSPNQYRVQKKAPTNPFAAAAASAALAAMLFVGSLPQVAEASNTAGQIQLNSLPPSSVLLDIKDLPVIGGLLSGTYAKVSDDSVITPSVTIKGPVDKFSAIRQAVGGHLEFDVSGLLGTHLDMDIAADEAGIATVRVSSPLIPRLPFKNLASSNPLYGNKASDWVKVTNLGNGETYYFNEKTDESQFEKPSF